MGLPYFFHSCSGPFLQSPLKMCVFVCVSGCMYELSLVWRQTDRQRESVEDRKNERGQLRCEACRCCQRDDGGAIQQSNSEFDTGSQFVHTHTHGNSYYLRHTAGSLNHTSFANKEGWLLSSIICVKSTFVMMPSKHLQHKCWLQKCHSGAFCFFHLFSLVLFALLPDFLVMLGASTSVCQCVSLTVPH